MKKITKKNFLQKTIIIIIAVICMNFIVPTYSHADFGGILFDPICDFICSIGDAVIWMIEGALTNTYEDTGGFGNGGFLIKDTEFNQAKDIFKNKPDGREVTEAKEVDTNTFNKGWFGLDNSYYIPVTDYSPEQIFSGTVGGLDVNFISPNEEKRNGGVADTLQPILANWYVALRNLAIVGLLSVLVYMGIRIILSSTASDKAKYKQMLMDWLVALVLVFFLHYIMSFTLTINESIVKAIGGNGGNSVHIKTSDGKEFYTNLLGEARFKTQYEDFGPKVTYMIMYIALVIYTVIFTWYYLKRVLMIAFLTMIAPLVALTYPIDKINDGKAQAFNFWLREYIFNVIIQPFHLIIYMAFVGSAMALAEENIIYMIAAMGFIMPAEKILKRFFGFEKAGTLGGLAAATAVGAGGSKIIGSMLDKGSKGGGKDGGSSDNTKPANPDKGIRYQKNKGVAGIEGPKGSGGPSGGSGGGPTGGLTGGSGPVPIGSGYGPTGGTSNGSGNNPYHVDNTGLDDTGSAWADYINNNPPEDNLNSGSGQDQLGSGSGSTGGSGGATGPILGQATVPKGPIGNLLSNAGKGAKNLYNYHIGEPIKNFRKSPKRAIKGIADKGLKKVFKAGISAGDALTNVGRSAINTTVRTAVGLGTAMVTGATGGGLSGAIMGFTGGAHFGGQLGSKVTDTAHNIGIGTNNAAKAIGNFARKELDIAGGDSKGRNEKIRTESRNQNNIDYVRQMMEKEGWIDEFGVKHDAGEKAMDTDVAHQMKNYEEYFAEGIGIEQAVSGHKTAQKYNISDKQVAQIARCGNDNNIDASMFDAENRERLGDKLNDINADFEGEGYSKKDARNMTDYTGKVLADIHGKGNRYKSINSQGQLSEKGTTSDEYKEIVNKASKSYTNKNKDGTDSKEPVYKKIELGNGKTAKRSSNGNTIIKHKPDEFGYQRVTELDKTGHVISDDYVKKGHKKKGN